ncbi:MAG: hypothetical protein K0R54_4393 [Clostridiaceae bacterium]|jgi:hypothetical protein|nr:hypothetical protein [Clostridiaceae bacterium]
MLKALLENKIGQTISDSEFAIICEIVTDDIKFNRVSFKKHTNLLYILGIGERSVTIFKKCA